MGSSSTPSSNLFHRNSRHCTGHKWRQYLNNNIYTSRASHYLCENPLSGNINTRLAMYKVSSLKFGRHLFKVSITDILWSFAACTALKIIHLVNIFNDNDVRVDSFPSHRRQLTLYGGQFRSFRLSTQLIKPNYNPKTLRYLQ